jgi:hypothetical protein
MTNLELLQQADAILSKPIISPEDIQEVKRIIRDEITLQMYEASQIDLKNESELNSLESETYEG